MKIASMFAMALMVLILGGFATSASAAGGGFGGQNLGGSFDSGGYPSCSSGSSSGGVTSSGSFCLGLNANTSSLDYANWSFYTSSQDTSRWTASCNMHGQLNSSEEWPQNQNWSQSISSGSMYTHASLNLNCYEWPSQDIIIQLQVQCLQLQLYLLTAPESQRADLIAQISAVQAQLATLQQMDRKQTLMISGDFGISPTTLEGSNFQYWEGTDMHYSYPNGYDNPPVITTSPSWNAKFDMYGQFTASTLAEAQAMGVAFVPEPATMALLVSGVVGLVVRRRKH